MTLLTCPICGAGLAVHVGRPDAAPFQCAGCAHGFFAAELTGDARRVFRPQHRDHGFSGVGRAVRLARKEEVVAAHERGVNVTVDMLPLLTTPQLQLLRRMLAAAPSHAARGLLTAMNTRLGG